MALEPRIRVIAINKLLLLPILSILFVEERYIE